MKSRRDDIEKYAVEYYLFLAKTVDIVGSDKHEYFLVTRLNNGDVHVVVRKMKKEGEQKPVIYDRLFKYEETEEIRLYGLGGEDLFIIEGESNRGIMVRVIGGEEEDEMHDRSHVTGWGRRNIFYDTESGNVFDFNSESKSKISPNPEVNQYDRTSFEYDVLMPSLTASINPDDGLFIGGGFMYTSHGFRKEPFKSRHRFLGSYAFNTSSYNFNYSGIYKAVLRDWDLNIDLDIKQPDYVNNFFGMGNESEFNEEIDETTDVDDAIDYYRLRFRSVSSAIGFSKKIGGFATFSIDHNFQAVEIQDPENDSRFINTYNDTREGVDFDAYKHYTGGTIDLTFDKRSDPNLTTAGVYWNNRLTYMTGIHNAHNSFSAFNSTLAFYYTLPPSLMLATRFGGGANFGEFEFYQSQILDGKAELRGYRKTRFYGDSKFYNNFEARWKLLSFRTYIFPASLGVLFFNDFGRVWLEGEDSGTWHHGFGGGIWISPFNRTVVSTELGISQEETLFYLRLGFMF